MIDEKITVAGSGTDRETEPVTIDLVTTHECEELLPALKPNRNAPCLCGSGKKYKRCCFVADHERERLRLLAEDAERRRQWAEEEAEFAATGKRRPMGKAAALALAAAAMVGSSGWRR